MVHCRRRLAAAAQLQTPDHLKWEWDGLEQVLGLGGELFKQMLYEVLK